MLKFYWLVKLLAVLIFIQLQWQSTTLFITFSHQCTINNLAYLIWDVRVYTIRFCVVYVYIPSDASIIHLLFHGISAHPVPFTSVEIDKFLHMSHPPIIHIPSHIYTLTYTLTYTTHYTYTLLSMTTTLRPSNSLQQFSPHHCRPHRSRWTGWTRRPQQWCCREHRVLPWHWTTVAKSSWQLERGLVAVTYFFPSICLT